MNFVDEETRLEFHKANTLMQMLAQAFETHCFGFGVQVTVIELLDEYSAVLGAALDNDAALAVLANFNSLYGRTEGDATLHLLSAEDDLWLIHGDLGKSLKHLI